MNDSEKPATRADLLELEINLSRELHKAERWMLSILIAYFCALFLIR
jgi:hypothetical protein